MAEFCPTCPDRGDCLGPIAGVRVLSMLTAGTVQGNAISISVINGIPQGQTDAYVRYYDEAMNYSQPIIVHGRTYEEASSNVLSYVDQVGGCQEPHETKRFLGLITARSCAAPDS